VGDSATTIDVNEVLSSNPSMLAASLTGIGNGTQNAVRLAQAFEDPLETLGGRSLKESYEDMVVRITQDVSIQAGKSDGLRNFYQTLESQHLATTGVNMDEEAVKMIFYQRVFQANSKLIQTSNELLDTLVNL
jgi:flagellar hook-associated protein 1